MDVSESIVKLIKFSFGIIEVLLVLNVIIKLLGALPTFVLFEWIYNFSAPFKSPFEGTFPPVVFNGRFVLDVSGIFAIVAYFIIAAILIAITKYIFKMSEKK